MTAERSDLENLFSNLNDLNLTIDGYDSPQIGKGNTAEVLDKMKIKAGERFVNNLKKIFEDEDAKITKKMSESEDVESLIPGQEIHFYSGFYERFGKALSSVIENETEAKVSFVVAGKGNQNWLNETEILLASPSGAERDVVLVIFDENYTHSRANYANLQVETRMRDYEGWEKIQELDGSVIPERNFNEEALGNSLRRVVCLARK